MTKTLVCSAPEDSYIQFQSGTRIYLKDCPQEWPAGGQLIGSNNNYFLVIDDDEPPTED